jgi:hypothetical protein
MLHVSESELDKRILQTLNQPKLGFDKVSQYFEERSITASLTA